MSTTPSEQPARHVISAHALRDVLMCERRVWLDTHGDPAQRDETSPDLLRLFELGVQHEQRVHDATAPTVTPIVAESWDEGVLITQDLVAQGVPVILGACLEAQTPLDMTDRVFTVRGQVDRLVRLPQFDDPVYAPVEIKQRSKPEDSDWVQLDYYVWLLGLVQGTAPAGELWLGADDAGFPRERLPHDYDEDRLMDVLLRVIALRDQHAEPGVRLESHCTLCHWYSLCYAIARMDGSIDLLYGISRTTRDNMREAGITTMAHIVAAAPDALQTIRGIGPKLAHRIRANARAWVENQPVWCAPLPELCRQPGWMFDLETHEVKGRTVPWCMGWCDVDGHTHIALVAPVQLPETTTLPDGQRVTLAPDSDGVWEVFADAVAGDDAPIYHWTGYETALLRGSAPAHVIARLEPRMADLHAALKGSLSLPLKSTSIKPVSVYFGFEWPGHQDYRAAYVDYCYWLEADNVEALMRSCTYQRADVQSMALVWCWLVAHTPPHGA